MTVNDFINDLCKLLTAERSEAKIAAEDIAADLLIWIEHLQWGTGALDARKREVAKRLMLLRGAHAQGAGTRKALIRLPAEFVELCREDGTHPDTVLRGFIADLCGIRNWVSEPRDDGYSSNGSDERDMAWAYYERVGYPWLNRGSE